MLRCTPKAGVVGELDKLMESKKLTPVISQSFLLAEVAPAKRASKNFNVTKTRST